MYRDGDLLPDMKISITRIGIGFLLSAVLAIPLGILMGAYKCAEAAHEPFVGFVRCVSVPAKILWREPPLGFLGLATDMVFKIAQPRLLSWAEMQKS